VVVKVMNREGSCHLSDADKALKWVLDNKDRYGIKIISFSVGASSEERNPILDEACNRMVDKGLVMCVAAGNSGPAIGSIVVPGDAEKVITVGAIDSHGGLYQLSSRGPTASGEIKPDLVTLGVNVVSALAQTRTNTSSMSGTSMAVPQVSGAIALLLEARPDLTPADVKRMLLKTAYDLGPSGPDNEYGYGALNLTAALESVDMTSGISAPSLVGLSLNKYRATVGDAVMIEAAAAGDIKAVNANIIGPDRTLEIPLDDFDANGIYSSQWETSFWTPGDYRIKVDLLGKFGEVDSLAVPFHLSGRERTSRDSRIYGFRMGGDREVWKKDRGGRPHQLQVWEHQPPSRRSNPDHLHWIHAR
jgi:serine protease AprX